MSDFKTSACPTCGAALVTGSTTDGWMWAGCPVAGKDHYVTAYRGDAAHTTPGPVPEANGEPVELIVFDVFECGAAVSLDADGALVVGHPSKLSAELVARIEANADALAAHLNALPWDLGRDAEALAEREAERRARPFVTALNGWATATGAEALWLDSLEKVHLSDGRAIGSGQAGSVRRAVNAMLNDTTRYRAVVKLFCEALELLPVAEATTVQPDAPRLRAVRPDVALSAFEVARQWNADGTLDRLPARLPVGELADWNAPAHAIRTALATMNRMGATYDEIEKARDVLFEIVPDVTRWLLANQESEAA